MYFALNISTEKKTVTLATLQATKQRNDEYLMEYIKRFRDIHLTAMTIVKKEP